MNEILLAAADRLEALARRTTDGEWRLGGLLASRPEVVARRPDGSSEHVAEARAATAEWITALSPALAPALIVWLRSADSDDAAATAFAEELLEQLDRGSR